MTMTTPLGRPDCHCQFLC